jgi:exopolyphosphatase / guanosine-5'-triphosphate,3'-diphosphate pyrophosphatase
MNPQRRAVIDVGTNSTKLLVAEVSGHTVQPLWEESTQTRLGRGFYRTRRLQPEAITATAKAVAQFAVSAREKEASAIRVIATSAARDAVNPEELQTAIESLCGLKVEIISGEQEADLVFRGVTSDARFAQGPLLLLDVGGGSTEFILGEGEQKYYQQSVLLGTVRLLEQLPHSEPPKPEELAACRAWLREFLVSEVRPALEQVMTVQKGGDRILTKSTTGKGAVQLVGTGGTMSILGCMEAKLETFDRQRLETTRLSLEGVQEHVERLWRMPLAERKQVPGLPPNRADVILTGVAIYESIMKNLGFAEIRLSTRGLRFAAVMG